MWRLTQRFQADHEETDLAGIGEYVDALEVLSKAGYVVFWPIVSNSMIEAMAETIRDSNLQDLTEQDIKAHFENYGLLWEKSVIKISGTATRIKTHLLYGRMFD